MRTGRIAAMILMAAMLAAPLAYAQFSGLMEGTELLFAAFGPDEIETVALAN